MMMNRKMTMTLKGKGFISRLNLLERIAKGITGGYVESYRIFVDVFPLLHRGDNAVMVQLDWDHMKDGSSFEPHQIEFLLMTINRSYHIHVKSMEHKDE